MLAVVLALTLAACTDAKPTASPSTAPASTVAVAASSIGLRLDAGNAPNIVVGLARRIRVTVDNTGAAPASGLWLASTATVAGSRGVAKEEWSRHFAGPCELRSGTTSCPLPSLPPGGAWSAVIRATVPLARAGTTRIGQSFVQLVSVAASAESPTLVARQVTLNLIGKSPSLTAHGCHSTRGTPACAVPSDGPGPPARPCSTARSGQQELTFRIEPDVPQPPCWRTSTVSSVRIVNATGDFGQRPRVVSGHLRGMGRYRVPPGKSTRLHMRPGNYFARGTHCMTASIYPGSCLDIWIVPAHG